MVFERKMNNYSFGRYARRTHPKPSISSRRRRKCQKKYEVEMKAQFHNEKMEHGEVRLTNLEKELVEPFRPNLKLKPGYVVSFQVLTMDSTFKVVQSLWMNIFLNGLKKDDLAYGQRPLTNIQGSSEITSSQH
jgi:hypothetical protein